MADWAERLMGASAWLQGQGPDYEIQQAEQQSIDKERRRKAIADQAMQRDKENASTVYQASEMLKAGDPAGAMQVLGKPLQNPTSLDKDTEVLATLHNGIQNGENVLPMMDALVKSAGANGLLDLPTAAAGPKPLPLEQMWEIRKRLTDSGVDPSDPRMVELNAAIAQEASLPGASGKDETWGVNPRRFNNGAQMLNSNLGNTMLIDEEGQQFRPGDPGFSDAVARARQSGFDATLMTSNLKERATLAKEYFVEAKAARKAIGNIDDAITALEQGGDTGGFWSMAPDLLVNDQTIAFRNAAQRMGLDIIGATTFGALSKGELDLAMATAVPPTMKKGELVKWLKARRKAQQKLSLELVKAAKHFEAGKSIGDWADKNVTYGETKGQGGTQQQGLSESALKYYQGAN